MRKITFLLLLLLLSIIAISQTDSTDSKKLSFKFSGFVNLNAILDFNGLDRYDDFTTSDIPINPTPYEDNFRLHMTARQSRLNFLTDYETQYGKIQAFVSGDFYSSNTDQHSYFRLREAYLKYGNLLLGQTNTTFGNPNIIPATIDFEGPNSAPALRNPMVKFEKSLTKGWSYTLAIEMRGTDIEPFSQTIKPFLTMPCFVGNITKAGDWGLITLSGMADITRYFNSDSIADKSFGFGGAVSAIINVCKKNHFSIFIIGGKGVANFTSDLSGLEYNGVPNISSDKLHMLNCVGGFIAYTQYWNNKFSSNIIASFLELEKTDLLEPLDFRYSKYALVNLFYSPLPRIQFGIEYVYGQLTVQNKESGDANRLQFLAQFNF